jgi:hypothetical protein
MRAFKVALYVLTIAISFFFGLWELRLKRQLTDEALAPQREDVSELDPLYELRRGFRRERILRSLPRETISKLRIVVTLKFVCVAILVVEVILLQR